MDGALSRATATVQAHGGKVLQYAGDSILAVFGAEQAQEDDVERAVRSGLACWSLARSSAPKCAKPTPTTASTSASASKPARCCSAAASTSRATSAASR
jgi:class 3 adenylate cyclase